MHVLAYCCQSFAESAARAAGVKPLTSPPLTADRFEPFWLGNYDFLYFDLHGREGDPAWYGDGGIKALTVEHLEQCRLDSAIVFAINCHLADENSPMMDALLDAGAKYVIGGDGQNWGPDRGPLYGAPLLGMWTRRGIAAGVPPLRALRMAKWAVKLRGVASEDTLAFRAYYRKDPK